MADRQGDAVTDPGGAGGGTARESESASRGRKPTQFQMGVGLALGIIGAVVGTILFLVVLAIIIGLAGGH